MNGGKDYVRDKIAGYANDMLALGKNFQKLFFAINWDTDKKFSFYILWIYRCQGIASWCFETYVAWRLRSNSGTYYKTGWCQTNFCINKVTHVNLLKNSTLEKV